MLRNPRQLINQLRVGYFCPKLISGRGTNLEVDNVCNTHSSQGYNRWKWKSPAVPYFGALYAFRNQETNSYCPNVGVALPQNDYGCYPHRIYVTPYMTLNVFDFFPAHLGYVHQPNTYTFDIGEHTLPYRKALKFYHTILF